MLDNFLVIVKILQPICKCCGVIEAIQIPSLDGFEVFIQAWNGIVVPVPTVGEDVFVSVNAGDIVRRAESNNVNKDLTVVLQ